MFERTVQLIGQDAFARLQAARVILFGVGGVGGWCAEALVRTGVAHLTMVDYDVVADSNRNRQVVATAINIGLSKVNEMRRRLLSIHPDADIVAIQQRYDASTAAQYDFNTYDYVIDAIDMVDSKMLLLYNASHSTATVFASMGAGRKWDTQQIQVADFWHVEGCPLARALRTRMRKSGLLPGKPILSVYSPQLCGDSGTIAPVVGCFGMIMADLVVQDIIRAGQA